MVNILPIVLPSHIILDCNGRWSLIQTLWFFDQLPEPTHEDLYRVTCIVSSNFFLFVTCFCNILCRFWNLSKLKNYNHHNITMPYHLQVFNKGIMILLFIWFKYKKKCPAHCIVYPRPILIIELFTCQADFFWINIIFDSCSGYQLLSWSHA